jgi:hypothetical protein
MNEELLAIYNQYKSVNPNVTEEMFNETYDSFGQKYIDIIQEEIKKKVEPANTDQPIIPDVVTEQLSGNPTNQVDPRFEQTVTQPILPTENSMESGSILVQPSSESGSISQDNGPELNLDATSTPILKPVQIAPVFSGNIIKDLNTPITPGINIGGNTALEFLAGKDNAPTENPKVEFKPLTQEELDLETKNKSVEDAKTKDFVKEYADKDYLNNKIPLVEKGIEYTAWVTSPEEVKQSNDNLSDLEKRGDVVINGVDEKTGNYKYEILSDSYKDNFNNYINDLNTQAGKENIDRAHFNQGNIGNTPQAPESVQYLNDLQKEYGVLFTEDQIQQLGTPETRNQLEINLETEKRLKENPNLDYNTVLQQVTSEKQGLTDPQKLAIGNSYVRDMFLGTPDNFLDDEKDEYRFYQQYFNNPENIAEFGDFMNDTGKAMFDSSWIKSNQTKKEQGRRKELFETFLNWKGRNDRLDLEINQRSFEDADAKAKKYREENNVDAYQTEVDKMNNALTNYNLASDKLTARNQEYNSIQNNFSKTLKIQKEKDDFQLRVQNGDTSANIQNVLGNVLLGAETSIQNAATGILRIGATPFGKGNVNDAIDILSEPISVGNVDIARISDRVINYKAGNSNYKEVNGNLYGVNKDGTLFRPTNVDKSKLEKTSEDTEYNISGLAFVTSKMLADILVTERTGGAISNTASKLSTALANSKKIASVFGEGSQLSKLASSYARLSQSPTSAMVNGWTVQMYNDNYMAAKNGGIESELNRNLYALSTSYLLAVIQKINPDTNFLKTINSEQKAIVSALMENNTQKALLGIQSFTKKALENSGKELIEENVQQLTQDFSNVIVNTLGDKKLQVSDVQDYKDVFVGTVVPSIIASGLGGRVNQAEVGGRKIDLTNLTRNELVTELARTNEGVNMLQNFRDNAFFDSQENEADKILAEVKERQKYIKKIPDVENYSTQTINQVIPILQEIDRKKKSETTDDGVFKGRIQQEVETLSTEVNSLLDNDQNNEQTAQSASQPETIQEQASTTESQSQQTETSTTSENRIATQEQDLNSITKLNWFNRNFLKGRPNFEYSLNGEKFVAETEKEAQDDINNFYNQQNESQQNNSNIPEQTITEAPIEFRNQANDTTQNIQPAESQSNKTTQSVQIDESIFNDNVDLNPEQEQLASTQLSDAVSLFESFNNRSEANPVSENVPIQNSRVSTNGKYNVVEKTSPDGSNSFELLDINDNPVNLTNKQKDVYVAEYINSKEYPETELNLQEGMQPDEVVKETIDKTQNPKELAEVIISTPQFDSQAIVGSKDWAIAQVIGGNNVSRESFIQNDDANNITNAIGRTYFGKNKSGKSLDNIAQEVSEQLSGDYSGESVTPQDIVDFIKKYPNDPSKAERPNNPLYDEAVSKFIALTGQNPTKNLLDKLIPSRGIESTTLNLKSAESEYNTLTAEQQNQLAQEYDSWFNNLSPEQKEEELNKTYPDYEQSNPTNNIQSENQSTLNTEGERNQNVSNQETIPQQQRSDQSFIPISEESFNSLIEQLKKPFKNAFKNLNVTTNLEEATQRANELGENTTDLEFKNNDNIYGFKLSDGTIYINPENLNANTPIHEFSHLWEQLMPNAWRTGLAIFKDTVTGKRIFNQLKTEGNYSTLTDDQIWSEALNTHIGNYGEWKNNNPKGKMKEFTDWVKKVFARIGNYFGIKTNPETSLQNFTEGVIGDLLSGIELETESNNISIDPKYSLANKSDFDNKGNIKQSVIDSINLEREKIKINSIENNTYLKAPNGEDTNLNENQWIDVRTERFKKWFGDWENDPKNASKIIDENGEPLVVYHASKAKFDEFRKDKISESEKWGGNKGIINKLRFLLQKPSSFGFFFTKDLSYINSNNSNTYSVFLNINNPLIAESNEESKFWSSVKNNSYDGAIWNNKLEIIAYEANQIKSALDNIGTFSLNNNKIQFSKGSEINKEVIPKTTFAKIVNTTSADGKQAGFEELTNSSWFNNLSEASKSGVTVDNFHNLMLDQARLIQENDSIRRNNIKDQAKQQVSKVKQDAKEKIASIIDKYKTKISEIKSDSNKSSRDKSLEQKRALRTAVKDIKSHLASNMYIGRITPTETNRLIRKASEIGMRKDISVAVNEFTKLYDDIRAKAESRVKQKEFTLDEYNELKPLVESMINNGDSINDIKESIRQQKLNNKKAGVLNETYDAQIQYIYDSINNENLTPEQAYDQMKAQQNKVVESMQNKMTRREKIKSATRLLIKNFTDRQYLPKKLLQEIGANNTVNRMITMAGASSRANEIYSQLEKKIFKGLKLNEKTDLNAMIVAKRIISIEKNRAERNLPPIKHPYSNPTKALEAMKSKLGDSKFTDLENRSNEYFKAFKDILGDMRNNGLISQDSYDNMIDIDYQPRVFIDRLLNAEGNLDEDGNYQNFSGQNGGLKSEIMKNLSQGSDSAIIDNAEWLLKTALSSRYKAMAMNEVNRKFMTEEFWKSKDRFDQIDPQNFANKSDRKFYEYFKELNKQIKDNPIIGTTEFGNPKYQYDSTPQGFKKAYYYVDGVRNEFFLSEPLHETWHDVADHPIFNDKSKRVAGLLSGSALIKAMATGYNPTFAFTNTPRDFMQTLVFSPEYSNNLLMGTFQLGYDQVKAINRMFKSDFQGKEDAIFQKYIEYGGGMDFLHIQGLLDSEQKTSKAIQKVLDSNFFQVATLMKLSKWSEMMTRMAIFERSIKNQLKDLGVKSLDDVTTENEKDDIYYQAVASARSIMDFNQGGLYTKDLDAVMPYLNAATQGTRVAIDAFRRNPIGTSTRMLQAGGIMASTAIGVSYALLAMARQMGDDDDDKDKSINEIILSTYDGLSQYQRANYINIVLPSKDDKGERHVFKIAKTQFVAPLSYMMEEGLLGVIRKIEGKPDKDFTKVLKETSWVANKNMTPIELANPVDFATGIMTKNPVAKAVLTYKTGYDFFKDEFVTFDVKKSNFPKELEGYKDPNVEDFYKGIGSETGSSPARMKALVESIVTTPETNPFVTMIYGGADLTNAVIQGNSKAEVAQEVKENIAKVFTKRLIGQASDFNRMRREREDVEREVNKAILIDEKLKIETDMLAKKYSAGTVNEKDIANKFSEMKIQGKELEKAYKRLNDKVSSTASDTRIYDIKYSTSNSNVAKAILIKKYFPQVYENSTEGQAIRDELKSFKIFSKDIQLELNELAKENK